MGIGVVTNIQFPSNCHLCSPLFTSLFNTLCHPTRLSTSRELILHAAWQWVFNHWRLGASLHYRRVQAPWGFYIILHQFYIYIRCNSILAIWIWYPALVLSTSRNMFPDEQQKPETPSCSCRKGEIRLFAIQICTYPYFILLSTKNFKLKWWGSLEPG